MGYLVLARNVNGKERGGITITIPPSTEERMMNIYVSSRNDWMSGKQVALKIEADDEINIVRDELLMGEK